MVDLGKGAAAEELAELVLAKQGIIAGGVGFDLRHQAAKGQRSNRNYREK